MQAVRFIDLSGNCRIETKLFFGHPEKPEDHGHELQHILVDVEALYTERHAQVFTTDKNVKTGINLYHPLI